MRNLTYETRYIVEVTRYVNYIMRNLTYVTRYILQNA